MRRRFSGIGRRSRIRFVGPDVLLSGCEVIPEGNEEADQQALTREDGQKEGATNTISSEDSGQPAAMTDEEKFMRDALDRFGAESSHHGYERHMLERD